MKISFELDRPIVFFDLETTGLNPVRDRIVEIAVVKVSPRGDMIEKDRRFNPGVPIPAEASAVHGITDEHVKDKPTFRQTAKSLAKLLEPCDLGGFNIRSFDLPMLLAEFERAGVDFDVGSRRLVDMKLIFHREEPRDLSAAAKFYLGRDHLDAHQALGDIRTTVAVLDAQLAHYPHLPRDMAGLHAYCDEVSRFRTEFERWFSETSGGLVFRRGKHKRNRLDDVALRDPGYLEWMLGADSMPGKVLAAVRDALERAAEALARDTSSNVRRSARSDPSPGEADQNQPGET